MKKLLAALIASLSLTGPTHADGGATAAWFLGGLIFGNAIAERRHYGPNPYYPGYGYPYPYYAPHHYTVPVPQYYPVPVPQYYPAPTQGYYPQPPTQYAPPQEVGYLYFCRQANAYYPQVDRCPGAWVRIEAR